jgi:uncharacterized membrane protein
MNPQAKPVPLQAIAWMTLASGISNLFWGFAASGAFLSTIIGALCIPFTILPAVLGVFELIYAAKLFSEPPQLTRPSTTLAVFQIAACLAGNLFSMAVGILALVFYNDPAVRDYFTRLNQTVSPAPAPASQSDLAPAPASEDPLPPPQESPAEPPQKPKRPPYKVA